jgi:hypothetical protein
MQMISYLLINRRKYKNPALLALRRDHPEFRFEQRTFDFAWSIACSRPHQQVLELLQLNARRQVPRDAWGILEGLADLTAEALRALRDWQYASYADTDISAPDPLMFHTGFKQAREPLLATPEDLCAISLFVYPVCPITRPVIWLDDDEPDRSAIPRAPRRSTPGTRAQNSFRS